MYKTIYKDITKFVIIIAMFAFSFSITWHIFDIPYLVNDTINGIDIYYFDTSNYLQNLDLSWTGLENIWKTLLPTRSWNEDILNNMALLFDYLYMPLNIALNIIRTACFLIIKLFALMGLITSPNTVIGGVTYQPAWFVQLFITIKDNFIIPYI